LIAFQATYQSNNQNTCYGFGKETKLISCQTWNITLLQSQNDSSPEESGLFKELQNYIQKLCPSTQQTTDRDKAASPMAMAELHIITAVIKAKQGCDVMTANIPNAFVQMDVEEEEIGA
jgi:hypothetical protein